MNQWWNYVVLIAIGIASAQQAIGQGYTPQEAAKRMVVPAGLHVELIASEPLVRQPVAIDFDNRGRLWVIQYLQYPNPAGLKRVAWDRYSRTTYDRVPEPPPHGPRGADRLTILEDQDGDGQYDSAKDFVAGLNLATGFAFGHGGVFVLQVPYLLFYPDRDQDDVPDGDPEVLLKGFGMEDAHSVANSLVWGPDGWLYGAQGSTVTANIRGIEFQQGVWRYHPLSHRFELFYEGGGNTWGVDFDDRGNLFASTNVGGNVLLHGVQGGNYWKSFGKHGALHQRHAYGYFEHVRHENIQGGHVTVGGIIYQGDTLPSKYRGSYIAANLLSHAVYWHRLARERSTFSARQEDPLLDSRDTWFAPSDVMVGPDGALYIADWHDKRTAHPDPDAEWDRTNGRIYRLQADHATPTHVPEFSERTSIELVDLSSLSNDWIRRRARGVLAERRDPAVWSLLRDRLFESNDVTITLQYLWALQVSGGLDDDALRLKLLKHPRADVRRWVVRLIGDRETLSDSLAEALLQLANDEPDVDVRSQLASSAARLPSKSALAIVRAICVQDRDADDTHIPLLLWWALERHTVTAIDDVSGLFADPSVSRTRMAREQLVGRLMRYWVAENSVACFTAAARLYREMSSQTGRRMLLSNTAKGLPLGRTDESAKPLLEAVAEDWSQACSDPLLIGVLARLGHKQAIDGARALVSDATANGELRLAMIELVGSLADQQAETPLLQLVGSGASPEMQLAAIRSLARFDDPEIVTTLLARYDALSDTLRHAAADLFFSRPKPTTVFLTAIDQGDLPATDVSPDQLRRAALHHDQEIDRLIAKHWGRIKPASTGEKLAEVRRLNNDLNAGSGEELRGHQLFQQHCGVCHRLFGEGKVLGPDLTTANRSDRAYLLENIIDPSLIVRKEFVNYTVQLDDGRVLVGLIVDQTPASITLADEKNVRTVIDSKEIEVLEPAARSLMPERLLEKLSPQELRDLFSFLQLAKPPQASDSTPSSATR